MHIVYKTSLWAIWGFLVLSTACSQGKKKLASPPGYDLNKPQKFNMPEELHEISGLAFYQGNDDMVYAEQDEDGRLFYLKPGDKNAGSCKFGKKGDYEDVAICNNYVIMLRSDGTLYTFPFSEVRNEEAAHVQEWKKMLPEGEYEGMWADASKGLIYVLCKHCADEKTSKTGKGYILQLSSDGAVSQSSSFSYDVQDIEAITGIKKISFHPSALANNPLTGEWYILSSVNKLLVITDGNWKVKQVYPLNAVLYNQPEGIAFDKKGNLYISNEGGETHAGNILKMSYSGSKKP